MRAGVGVTGARKEDPFAIQMWRPYVRTEAKFIWRISTCTLRMVGMDPTRGADAGVALPTTTVPTRPVEGGAIVDEQVDVPECGRKGRRGLVRGLD